MSRASCGHDQVFAGCHPQRGVSPVLQPRSRVAGRDQFHRASLPQNRDLTRPTYEMHKHASCDFFDRHFYLSVQRQLPGRLSATAAYVGTLGRNLNTFIDANYAPYSTLGTGALSTSGTNLDTRRQFDAGIAGAPGTLNGLTYLIAGQTSNYNGLQVSATKTMSRGFSVTGFYVWSRALESSNPTENGQMSAQDFGVFGKPFTSTNNSGRPRRRPSGRMWPHGPKP